MRVKKRPQGRGCPSFHEDQFLSPLLVPALSLFLSGFNSVCIFMSPVIHLAPVCQQPSMENKSLTLGLEWIMEANLRTRKGDLTCVPPQIEMLQCHWARGCHQIRTQLGRDAGGSLGFPGASDSKESACNARDQGFCLWIRKMSPKIPLETSSFLWKRPLSLSTLLLCSWVLPFAQKSEIASEWFFHSKESRLLYSWKEIIKTSGRQWELP